MEIRESSSERRVVGEERSSSSTLHVGTEDKEKKICMWICMWMCDAVDVFLMYASVAVVRFNKESSARCVPVSAYQPVTSPCQYCQYTTLHSPVAIWANCTQPSQHHTTRLLVIVQYCCKSKNDMMGKYSLLIYLIVKVKLRPNLTVI